MIHLPASVRVYLCLTACAIRKSFDGLHQLVRDYLALDAFAGHLFVFTSRRRDRLKILYWDRDGFAVWSKRLEEGTYAMPLADSAGNHRRVDQIRPFSGPDRVRDILDAVFVDYHLKKLAKELYNPQPQHYIYQT
jgi:transposase